MIITDIVRLSNQPSITYGITNYNHYLLVYTFCTIQYFKYLDTYILFTVHGLCIILHYYHY